MRLLIVDDDAGLRHSLALLLQEAGYEVVAEGDPEEALTRAAAESFDLILCDVRMPKMDGLTFLGRYRARHGSALLIMMSAYGNEDAAIAAMHEGAYDYLPKPFRPDEVIMTVRKAEERERLRREVETLRSSLGVDPVRDLMIFESRAMRDLLELAGRVAQHDTTVLITGESGTGKEVLARAIHRLSPRTERAFTAINCAAIPGQLLESELFGHAKGAFTGAVADRHGAVRGRARRHAAPRRDRRPSARPAGQAPARAGGGRNPPGGGRDAKRVDVRVIAATAKPLEQAVEQGEFRADLFYRLNVVRLHLPPLRERPEDVPALLTHFARQAATRMGRAVSLTPAALASLTHHAWPGNVRELRNAVERAVVLGAGGPLDIKDFGLGNGNGQRPWQRGAGCKRRRLQRHPRPQDPGGGDRASRHSEGAPGLGREPPPGGEPPRHQPPYPLLQDASPAGPGAARLTQTAALRATRCTERARR